MNTKSYDAIIIGAGQGGVPLANHFAAEGKQTALIERSHVGGTCVNVGCTPTKTLAASAKAAYLAGRAADYGIDIPSYSVNMRRVRQRKRDIVEMFRSGSEKRIEDADNLELIRGDARFIAPRRIVIEKTNGENLIAEAPLIIIDTGSRPRIPEINGLNNAPFLTSTTIMELDHVPEHLLIIGGGYIGCEFGQMFSRFGSRVSIIQRSEHLLPREDDEICEHIEQYFTEDGIQVYCNAEATGIHRETDSIIRLEMQADDETIEIKGSHLLIAAGRVPETARLDLEAAGIGTDKKGFIEVNEYLETGINGIFAVGDVKGGPAFTHISYDDYRIVRDRLSAKSARTASSRTIPYTVYIDPQLGRIGINKKEAEKMDIRIQEAKMSMEYSARALENAESRGIMKVCIDPYSKRILGCSILGQEGGELMSAVQIAMLGKLPYTVLQEAPFAHPTYAESFNTLFGFLQ